MTPLNNSSLLEIQMVDDEALLDCMMQDLADAPELYRPTNYWSLYEKPILKELSTIGLRDLRRRKKSALRGFVGGESIRDACPVILTRIRFLYNRLTRHIPGWAAFLENFSQWLTENATGDPLYDIDRASAHFLMSRYMDSLAQEFGAVPITDLSCSLVGNPEDIMEIGGKSYTPSFLSHYVRYVYLSRFADFSEFKYIVELGSGLGQFAEILHQISPKTPVILFDIPPSLYVGERYLSRTFPDDAVGYTETRQWADCDKIRPGKIYFFGSFKFPLVKDLAKNLFINCGSFQEMEPHVVRNYLSIVNQSSETVYMNECFKGKATARGVGFPGVLKQTVFSDYSESLSNFECVDRSKAISAKGPTPVSEDICFYRRR